MSDNVLRAERGKSSIANSAIQRYFGRLSRNTFLFAFASLFADISTEMLYPVLPVFLTQTLKASGSIVGLVDGFAQALQNIVQGFSGYRKSPARYSARPEQSRLPGQRCCRLLSAFASEKPVTPGRASPWRYQRIGSRRRKGTCSLKACQSIAGSLN